MSHFEEVMRSLRCQRCDLKLVDDVAFIGAGIVDIKIPNSPQSNARVSLCGSCNVSLFEFLVPECTMSEEYRELKDEFSQTLVRRIAERGL